MGQMSQEQINVDLFDEVKRLKAKLQEIEEHCIHCDADERAIEPHEILDIIREIIE
jgi:hypothetical protein